MTRIQLIIGSVRPSRVGPRIAEWVADIGRSIEGLEFETVDLKHWHLPLDDEPHQPKRREPGGYLQPHTRAWSAQVSRGRGFVFVTPQYNWGYPASLKNALDHLYYEWSDKPAVIVSYGHRGGSKAASQLREVLHGLQMRPVERMPALVLKPDMLDADRQLVDPAGAFEPQRDEVRSALDDLARALADAAGTR